MTARRLLIAAGLAMVLGCDPVAREVPCNTYVAGGFNRENRFAFAIDQKGWPALGVEGATIELTFLVASGKPQSVDLVHVVDDHELERWTLDVPTEDGKLPVCVLTANPATSMCGARIRIAPQDPRGYWYLRGNDDLLEAGMSFVLCRRPPPPVAPAAPVPIL
jgi:hypothetical protein